MPVPVSWLSITHYFREDFTYPGRLDHSIVAALDRFTNIVGCKALILDDWRPYDEKNPNSRHAFGDALDVVFPGIDPLKILALAKSSGLFDGIGIYLNERNAVSFHFDKRGTSASWGAFIQPAVDSETGKAIRQNVYVTMADVVGKIETFAGRFYDVTAEMVKKKNDDDRGATARVYPTPETLTETKETKPCQPGGLLPDLPETKANPPGFKRTKSLQHLKLICLRPFRYLKTLFRT
jgi:hypothetical protein